MRFISWNCRGLRRLATVRALIKEFDPIGIFLIETKCADEVVRQIMQSIGFSFFISAPPQGCKGGLVFCWRPNLQMEVLLCSPNIIHLLCHTGNDTPSFFCSLVYGPTRWGRKGIFLGGYAAT